MDQISVHEIRIYLAFQAAASWMTAKEIAKAASVAERTARAHCAKLAKCGVLEESKVFAGYRYRLSEKTSKEKSARLLRLQEASKVFDEGDSHAG